MALTSTLMVPRLTNAKGPFYEIDYRRVPQKM